MKAFLLNSVGLVTMLVFFVSLSAFACCATTSSGASTTDAIVRSQLDLLADIAGPASKATHDGCQAAKQAAVDEVKAGRSTTATATAQVAKIRERCAQMEKTFDDIREAQDVAASYVETGVIDQAQVQLEKARALFKSLEENPLSALLDFVDAGPINAHDGGAP